MFSLKKYPFSTQTVNSNFYWKALKRQRESIQCKRPDKWKKLCLHLPPLQTTWPHINHCLTVSGSQKTDSHFPSLLFSLSSLYSHNFSLFTKMTFQLKRHCFDIIEEMQSWKVLNIVTHEEFQQCTESLKNQWNPCSHR